MFRVEFFVEDKNVGHALRGLLGIAIGHPVATPVMNAETKGGKIVQQTNGNMPSQFMDYVTKSNISSFQPKDVAAWLVEHGRSKLSATYICKHCVSAGFARRTGNSAASTYHVIKALPKPKKG